jgi:DNA-binding CsgD family transcriptional regulator
MAANRNVSAANSVKPGYLTPRQRQVLTLAALEYTTEDIAMLIDREPKTVESHLASIYQRFHVHSRVGAVVKAMSLGELPSDSNKLLELAKLSEGAPWTSPKILYPSILDRVAIKQAMVRNAR